MDNVEKIILYKRKEECCGCGACYAICPFSAIKMVCDDEGFQYPEILEDRCKKCGLCIKTCPFKLHKVQKCY